MGVTRRAAVVAIAGAAALGLSGCAGAWYGAPWGQAESESVGGRYADYLEVEPDDGEGWAADEGEGWTSVDGEAPFEEVAPYSWADDHDDAVPVLDLAFTGTDDLPADEVSLEVAAQGESADGWMIFETWHSGPVDPTDPVMVHGPPSLTGADEVLVSVNVWTDDVTDIMWTGVFRPVEGGWRPVEATASDDAPTALSLDLATSRPSIPSLAWEAEQAFWGPTVWSTDGFDWGRSFEGGTEALTIRVEGDVPDYVSVAVDALPVIESPGSLTLFQSDVEEAGTITVRGPDDVTLFAGDDALLDLQVWVITDDDVLDWSTTVDLSDGEWVRAEDPGAGPIELVLDLDAETLTEEAP